MECAVLAYEWKYVCKRKLRSPRIRSPKIGLPNADDENQESKNQKWLADHRRNRTFADPMGKEMREHTFQTAQAVENSGWRTCWVPLGSPVWQTTLRQRLICEPWNWKHFESMTCALEEHQWAERFDALVLNHALVTRRGRDRAICQWMTVFTAQWLARTRPSSRAPIVCAGAVFIETRDAERAEKPWSPRWWVNARKFAKSALNHPKWAEYKTHGLVGMRQWRRLCMSDGKWMHARSICSVNTMRLKQRSWTRT